MFEKLTAYELDDTFATNWQPVAQLLSERMRSELASL